MNGKEWDEVNFDDNDWDNADWELDEAYTGTNYEPTEDLSDGINNGQRVRDLRMLVDMTPEEVADYAMISVKDLLAIEAGMLRLERPLAQLLANAIGVAISDVWVEKDKAA